MIRRLLAFVLILICLVSFSGTSFAITKVDGSDMAGLGGSIFEFDYKIEGKSVKLEEYNGSTGILVIQPSYEINGQKYNTDLSESSNLIDSDSVHSVFISEGVDEIDDALLNSSEVKRIYVPRSLKIISNRVFTYMHNWDGEELEIHYGGSQKEFESKLTDKTGTPDKDEYAQKGGEWANKFNKWIGGGYDPNDYTFYFNSTLEDFIAPYSVGETTDASGSEQGHTESAPVEASITDADASIGSIDEGLKSENERLQSTVVALQAQIESLTSSTEELKSENETLTLKNNEYKKQVESLQADNEELQKSVAALVKQNSSFSASIQELKAEKETLATNNEEYKQQVETLQAENKELSGVKAEKDILESENKKLNERKEKLEDELASLKSEHKTLKAEKDRLQNIVTEMEKAGGNKATVEDIGKSSDDSSEKDYSMLINPSQEYVVMRLSTVDDIAFIQAATEDHDPNGKLGKKGGYTAQIYFSSPLVNPSYATNSNLDIIEIGTEAGGSIEVYETVEYAEKRDAYLSQFDGQGFLSPGLHTVVGSVIIRLSDDLTASQQSKLEQDIINALTSSVMPEITFGSESTAEGTAVESSKNLYSSEGDVILYDKDDILIYLTRKYEIRRSLDGKAVYFDCVVENGSTHSITLNGEDCSVNGWESSAYFNGSSGLYFEVGSRKKAKGDVGISIGAANLEDYNEIEDIEFTLGLLYDGKNPYLGTPDATETIRLEFDDGIMIRTE